MIGMPAACPALVGDWYQGIRVTLDKCWADSTRERRARAEGRQSPGFACNASVDHPLGLCAEHAAEILEAR